jgi:16S rRNA (adenine1518-N6/adenine1519-N6)-dimethyltransferase
MHSPRKRFGQHFLHDQAIIQHIIAAIAPKPGDHLIEIGPGQGALTFPLLKQTHQLEAVELDRDLIPLLQEQSKPFGELTIHSGDVLAFDFAGVKHDDRMLRVFGNLPYNISTPLIFHLLTFAAITSDMVFMLQKEVAERLAAAPDTNHYGRLSVMVQYHCQVELLFDVPATAFRPPPQVESAIVRLLPYQTVPYPAQDYALLEKLVKQAFGQRRKTLRNSLKEMVSEAVWTECQIDSQLRPETLSVKAFVELSNAVAARNEA